ncbi:MAG: carboxypeptidase-like regulatory domain-containing protein, partial [Bacteroidales bacterium]|nr:carboxypeptidase-like regulatory domain-containing protein [Bacteroidales bacterium]
MKKITVILFVVFSCLQVFAQSKFAGRIFDAETKEPLAFVNIIYNSKNQGVSTDLDGYFKISDFGGIEFLKLSYIGYQSLHIDKSEIGSKHYLEIPMHSEVTTISEVTVLPGENPAHRIINLVVANANKNNPEKIRSFSYISYNKMYFTVDFKPSADSVKRQDTVTDAKSQEQPLSELFAKQHLLLLESVTERSFKLPDNNKEKVLAHRISGMKNPAFTLLATQFQSMSFYNDYISLLDKRYLSPISKGSVNKYFFQIEDTMYNASLDTIFVISYRPYKGKVFEGLSGVMNVNSNGYAIENITARPHERSMMFDVSIQQKYELVDSVQWFPVQLNTNIIMNMLQVADAGSEAEGAMKTAPIIGVGKSYISDISLNPDLKRKDFSNLDVQVEDKANKQDEDFWNQYRKDSLTSKDIETYRVVDSIGKSMNIDKTIELLEILANGYIPVKFINIDLSSILWFNEYEKLRLGLGIETNQKLCKWMSVGAYGAYGIRDKAWKYGTNLKLNLWNKHDLSLSVAYKRDLSFSDAIYFNKKSNLLSAQSLNEWFLEEMDSISEHKLAVDFTAFRYLHAQLQYRYFTKDIINTDRYCFSEPIEKRYTSSEIGLYLKFAYKEKFFQTPKGTKISLGTKYPVFYFNFIKS